MPVDGHPPRPTNRPFGTVLCPPCRVGLHDECRGAVVVCECWTEVLIDTEDQDDD